MPHDEQQQRSEECAVELARAVKRVDVLAAYAARKIDAPEMDRRMYVIERKMCDKRAALIRKRLAQSEA